MGDVDRCTCRSAVSSMAWVTLAFRLAFFQLSALSAPDEHSGRSATGCDSGGEGRDREDENVQLMGTGERAAIHEKVDEGELCRTVLVSLRGAAGARELYGGAVVMAAVGTEVALPGAEALC